MKFRLLIVFIFLFGCTNNTTRINYKSPYTANGFAYIYNETDYKNKVLKGKLDNSKLQISHNKLKTNTLIKLINPETKDYLVLKNTKRIHYPEFYKILITDKVAEKLKINKELPLVEVLEIKKNKSFIAKKAKIFTEEKKIPSNAPITSVQISNISKNENKSKKKTLKNKIYLVIATFYSEETAEFLKKRITKEISGYDIKKLKIVKKSNKKTSLISGPYNTINLVKNDYILFKNFGFEELDITINE